MLTKTENLTTNRKEPWQGKPIHGPAKLQAMGRPLVIKSILLE